MVPTEGATDSYERTFTEADVRQFAAVTEDDQPRHTEPDQQGRLLVHGLLTGSMLTKLGGDREMLAREMTFEFRRPVYTGDRVRCEWTNEAVTERDDGWLVEASVVCRRVETENDNPDGDRTDGETRESDGECVLEATVEGLVRENV